MGFKSAKPIEVKSPSPLLDKCHFNFGEFKYSDNIGEENLNDLNNIDIKGKTVVEEANSCTSFIINTKNNKRYTPFTNKAKFYLYGWSINNKKCLKFKYPTIFVLGAYKTGKSKIINLLVEMNICSEDEVTNTLGEDIYLFKYGDSKFYIIDTEGFYQPDLSSRDDLVFELLQNHVLFSCDFLIYVVDKITNNEFIQIKKFMRIYEQSNSMKNMAIIHNFKDIKCEKKLNQIVERDIIKLFKDDIEIEDNKFIFKTGTMISDSRKYVHHYALANNDMFLNINKGVLFELKSKIINCSFDKKTTDSLISIGDTIYETLNQYFKLPSEYMIGIDDDQKDNENTFFGTHNLSGKVRSSMNSLITWKNPYYELNQEEEKDYLNIYITCAGINYNPDLKNSFIYKPINSRRIQITATRNNYKKEVGEMIIKIDLDSEISLTEDSMKQNIIENLGAGIIVLRLRKNGRIITDN